MTALLKHPDVDTNAQNTLGNAPLGITAFKDRLFACAALLARPEVDIAAENAVGRSALAIAVRKGHRGIADAIRIEAARRARVTAAARLCVLWQRTDALPGDGTLAARLGVAEKALEGLGCGVLLFSERLPRELVPSIVLWAAGDPAVPTAGPEFRGDPAGDGPADSEALTGDVLTAAVPEAVASDSGSVAAVPEALASDAGPVAAAPPGRRRGYVWWRDVLGAPTLVASPMVAGSDLAFRLLARSYDAQLVYTPMLHARQFADDATYRRNTFSTVDEERRRPGGLIAQFAANDAETAVRAARFLEHQVDAVDLNCGCPQPCAKKGRYGAFLLREPEVACAVVRAWDASLVCAATAKIRLLDGGSRHASERHLQGTVRFAEAIEAAGASMITGEFAVAWRCRAIAPVPHRRTAAAGPR